jgi:hypothetical protein
MAALAEVMCYRLVGNAKALTDLAQRETLLPQPHNLTTPSKVRPLTAPFAAHG